jgi:hypothetical protein
LRTRLCVGSLFWKTECFRCEWRLFFLKEELLGEKVGMLVKWLFL